MRIVFFDTETGGLELHHPTIQIAAAAVDMRDGKDLGAFECKIKFNPAECSERALEINSYDPDVWEREAIGPAQAVHDFFDFLRRHADMDMVSKRGRPYQVARLGGHNIANFDIPRIRNLAAEAFMPACWWYPLDTLHLALWHYVASDDPPPNYRLTTLAEKLGIATDNAHDALADVRLSAAVALKLNPGTATPADTDAPAVPGRSTGAKAPGG